jgi:transcriptional regulator of acetoin/glycerol metabolism
MLDLTGVEVAERPELRHLVAHSARSIENALALQRPHKLLLRLNWPGFPVGDDMDGLIGLDTDGYVTTANRTARQLLPQLGMTATTSIHCRDLFDAARRTTPGVEAPLWSGLRLHVHASLSERNANAAAMPQGPVPPAPSQALPLREVETALIQKAVEEARGNVAQAARALGISRATVYRKLAQRGPSSRNS